MLRERGLDVVFLSAEVFGWGSRLQEWARSERLPSFALPKTVIVSVDAHGLGFWKSANEFLVGVPSTSLAEVCAIGDAITFGFKLCNVEQRIEFGLRPRRSVPLGGQVQMCGVTSFPRDSWIFRR